MADQRHRRSTPPGEGGGEPLAILVAKSISPGAKELLRAERVGYYDSGGSLYLSARGGYIYFDRPPPRSLSRSMRSLCPSKRRHLREPSALLDAWATQLGAMRPPALRRYFVPAMKPDCLMERLGQVFEAHSVEYAVSFEGAAQRYAPFLTVVSQVRCRLLAGSGGDAAIVELGARVESEGANLTVIEAKSAGDPLVSERVGRVWLASPVQVYLDLLRGDGPAKEMAEHLRRQRIAL